MNITGQQQIQKDKEPRQPDLQEDQGLDEEEFEFTNKGGQNKADDEFDEIVGALQDIVIDPQFEQQQKDFLEGNCLAFDNEEENKVEYMTVFKDYQEKLENYIQKKLKEVNPNLNMKDFLSQLKSRIDEIDPQLLDMLETFTDFQLFKEHMLAHKKLLLSLKKKSKKFEEYKQEKEGELSALEQGLGELNIAGHAAEIHKENEAPLKEGKVNQDVLENKENLKKGQEMNLEKKSKQEESAGPQKKVATKANPDYVPQQKENIFS